MRSLDFSHGIALWFLLGTFGYAGTVQYHRLKASYERLSTVAGLIALAVAILCFTYVVGASAPIPVFW